ncbi:MAG: hypothetical protein RQ741_06305 [Wenzhouxiangellaceae bacterium]|nr:hypothetical protein [Wenzhouxiangellaceae bacterium]
MIVQMGWMDGNGKPNAKSQRNPGIQSIDCMQRQASNEFRRHQRHDPNPSVSSTIRQGRGSGLFPKSETPAKCAMPINSGLDGPNR